MKILQKREGCVNMGIWIRRQDKKKLKVVSDIYIKTLYQHKETKAYTIFNNGENIITVYSVCEMGNYSSKEKAIKVLNMIQNYIIESNFVGYVNGEVDSKFYTQSVGVFQMPQDEEV